MSTGEEESFRSPSHWGKPDEIDMKLFGSYVVPGRRPVTTRQANGCAWHRHSRSAPLAPIQAPTSLAPCFFEISRIVLAPDGNPQSGQDGINVINVINVIKS